MIFYININIYKIKCVMIINIMPEFTLNIRYEEIMYKDIKNKNDFINIR